MPKTYPVSGRAIDRHVVGACVTPNLSELFAKRRESDAELHANSTWANHPVAVSSKKAAIEDYKAGAKPRDALIAELAGALDESCWCGSMLPPEICVACEALVKIRAFAEGAEK